MLAVCALIPQAAFAQAKEKKTVRVGWYESAFHRTDQFGRKSGYGYEYQQRIAVYTGWTYEYVEGSWSELLEKLKELDDVSYVRFASVYREFKDVETFMAELNELKKEKVAS